MKKYAKVINQETKACDVGLGTNTKYYVSLGMKLQDVEQAYDGGWYLKGYAPAKPAPTVEEQIAALEKQIEELNAKMLRDIIVLNDVNATEEEKAEAQTYFDTKLAQKQELVDQINELKGSSNNNEVVEENTEEII